jgi:hypothetical protein
MSSAENGIYNPGRPENGPQLSVSLLLGLRSPFFLDCCGEVTCLLAAIEYRARRPGERGPMKIRIVGLASLGFAIFVQPAFAGPVAVPGPIAGVGLPALALIGGAYWLGRKFFGHKR